MNDEYNIYYIYEYFSSKDGTVSTRNDGMIEIKKGSTYYVGKGKGNRISTGIRNSDCERFKNDVGWNYRVLKENMTEVEAFFYENEVIRNYRESELYLTNKLDGNVNYINPSIISSVKYLIDLNKLGILKMTQEEIALETESYGGLVHELSNTDEEDEKHKYYEIIPECPENIDYFILKYDANKVTDRDIKYGNIKYVLELLESGLLKANQREIADLFNENTTVVSGIKKGKYNNIKPVKPNNLGEILKMFDPSKLNESEVREGTAKYILDNYLDNILEITKRELSKELTKYYGVEIKEGWLQDLLRKRKEIRLVEPPACLRAILFSKYKINIPKRNAFV